MYATHKLLQRDAKLTGLVWEWQDMVEGHIIQLTNNADQSRTFAWIAMHERKLYILEGTVPKGYPEPGLFQQSWGWVDKDGNGIRYQSHLLQLVPRSGRVPETLGWRRRPWRWRRCCRRWGGCRHSGGYRRSRGYWPISQEAPDPVPLDGPPAFSRGSQRRILRACSRETENTH